MGTQERGSSVFQRDLKKGRKRWQNIPIGKLPISKRLGDKTVFVLQESDPVQLDHKCYLF